MHGAFTISIRSICVNRDVSPNCLARPRGPTTRCTGSAQATRQRKNGPRRCRPSGERIVGIGFVSFQVVSSSSSRERLARGPRAPCRLQAIVILTLAPSVCRTDRPPPKRLPAMEGSLPETLKRLPILVLLRRSFLLLALPKYAENGRTEELIE
jgi:hypothetical protein